MKLLSTLLALALTGAASIANAQIRVVQPYAHATSQGQATAAVYLRLTNTGPVIDKLIGAATPVARRVELHTMALEGNVMRMAELDGIPVAPGRDVELSPGFAHLMLMDLTGPLIGGTEFPLQLTFQQAGTVNVTVKVEGARTEQKARQ